MLMTRIRELPCFTDSLQVELDASVAAIRNPNLRPSIGHHLLKLAPEHSSGIRAAIEAEEKAWRNPTLRTFLEDIYRGRAILWIGAGFSLPPGPRPNNHLTGGDIRNALITNLDCEGSLGGPELDKSQLQNLPLGAVAEMYERRYKREGLIAELERLCRTNLPTQPLSQHQRLARLGQFRFIITTNWDRLIETAFAGIANDNHPRLSVIRCDKDVTHIDLSTTTMLKIHGDYDPSDGRFDVAPCVTDTDFHSLSRTQPAVFNLLKALFTSHRVVVIGFNPSDYNFLRLFDFLSGTLKEWSRQLCFVDPHPPIYQYIGEGSADYIPMPADDFLAYVETFHEYQGGTVGFASREPRKNQGAIKFWAESQCNLATAIQTLFPHLARVEVVDPSQLPIANRTEGESAKEAVGRRAAHLLREFVKPRDTIALSCGSTLKFLAEHAEDHWETFENVKLVGTSVAAFDDCNVVAPYGLITFLAQRLRRRSVDARAYQLPGDFCKLLAPLEFRKFIGAAEDAPSQDVTRSIDAYLTEASQANVFLFGVGSLGAPTGGLFAYIRACLKACKVPPMDVKKPFEERVKRYYRILRDLGYLGDLTYRLFKVVDKENKRTIVFMNPEEIHKCVEMKDKATPLFREFLVRLLWQVRTIAPEQILLASQDADRLVALVASGREKAAPVYALCSSGYGNTLIIDKALAVELLDLKDFRPKLPASRANETWSI